MSAILIKLATIVFVLLGQVQAGGQFKDALAASLSEYLPAEETIAPAPSEPAATIETGPQAPLVSLPIAISSPTPGITAAAAGVYDAATLLPLFEKNAREDRPVASLAKLMTAEVVMRELNLDDRVEISARAVRTDGDDLRASAGEEFLVRDLLGASLVASVNDAAMALAEKGGNGSVDFFVNKMNEAAAALRLGQTAFENPVGFDAEGQMSSARDMALLLARLMTREATKEYLAKHELTIQSTAGREITLRNTDDLLGSEDNGFRVLGGKTGTTGGAGECLATYLELSGGQEIIVVVLGSSDRYGDTRKIVKSVSESYIW